MRRGAHILAWLAFASYLLIAWAGHWLHNHDHAHRHNACAVAMAWDALRSHDHAGEHHDHHHPGHAHDDHRHDGHCHAAHEHGDHAHGPVEDACAADDGPASPCQHAPGEEHNCFVCQMLAQTPCPVEPVALQAIDEPLSEFIPTARPLTIVSILGVAFPRGPPHA